MTKGPKISIITACYNAEKTIEQTIQSVINQDYDNIEYIIVDGASTDRTMEIVEKYRDKITAVISEPDEGIYDAFNKGLKASSGDYIYYLNADDFICNNTIISSVAEKIISEGYPIVIYGGVIVKNIDSDYQYIVNKQTSILEMSDGIMIPHQAVFVSKEKMLEENGFDLEYKIASDFELIIKIYKKYENKFVYFPLNIACYTLGGFSSDFKNQRLLENEYNKILQKHFSKYYTSKQSNDLFYKKWIENILFYNKSMSEVLVEKGIKRVAIFGSGEVSNILLRDFLNNGIDVITLLDNNKQKIGLEMNGVKIAEPDWLVDNFYLVEAVIFGFEGYHEEAVIEQLNGYKISKSISYFSWREIIALL